jgi:hypothetical protein
MAADAIWDRGARVVTTLRSAGHQAWLVGGCVRDRLLGRPIKDADIATSAEPDEVEDLFPRTVAVGKAFGVIKVLVEDGEVEVASLRADDRYVDGRRPVAIRRGSLQEDAERRDLTVNALYADPDGTITDPVHGLPDLQARILRGIGDPAARLAEDRLRVLRVLRFAAVLGFAIEPATAAAVRATAIGGVARERVLDELAKAGSAGAAGSFLRGCVVHGQLDAVAPCARPEVSSAILDRLGPAPLEVVLAVWLQDLTTDAARAWVSMQPMPAEARRTVPWLIATAPHLGVLPVSDRRRALRQARGADLAALAAAMDPIGAKDYIKWASREADPGSCPLSAADLLAAGVPAGPGLGAALRRAEDAWLNDAALDQAQLLAIARSGA